MLRPKRQSASTVTVTAPIGGWNAVTQLASMSPNEAVIMDNWFCLPTELMVRKGYTQWATGIPGNVLSFINYDNSSGTTKLFAVSDSSGTCAIYDISTGGTVGAAVVSSLTNAKFHSAQMANSGGTFTVAVNGSDLGRIYNGSTWSTLSLTGVTSSSLSDIQLHKRRLWFVEKNSLKAWYLATDAVTGTATSFDFGPIFRQGGKIVKIDTWTLDAGWGMDDYFVVITSKGEIAVYTGTDPASASTWTLQGVYYVGSPVGNYPTCKYGGDALLLNKDGLIPLSQCLMSSRVSTRMSITNKIQQRITQATSDYANNYGWQVILNPPENMLLINVPISGSTSEQYVMNTITGAWSRFTGINAYSWVFSSEKLFFGYAGKVYKFWDGEDDLGNSIVTDLLPAFSSFGNQAQIKRWTMTRVSMGYDSAFAFSGQMNIDFDQSSAPPTPYNVVSATSGIWDTSTWDNANWGGSIIPFSRWQMAAGVGYYGTFRIKTSSKGADVRYYATDYILEAGGVI